MDTKKLCLGVLMLGDASGYDIKKRLEEVFAHYMNVSSNAVYPALKSLAKEGLVKFKTVKQESYPDKKIYSLTKEGKAVFTDALQVLSPRHKVRSQLMLLMFFADKLSGKRMQEILDERLAELDHWKKVCKEWEESEESNKAGVGPHFLVDYVMARMKAETNFIKKHSDKLIKQLEVK